MAKTRKHRTPPRRLRQHGGVGDDAPIISITIPLRFGFMPEYSFAEYIRLDPSLGPALQATKDRYGWPDIHLAQAEIMRSFSPQSMVDRIFTEAEDENGEPIFGNIITADWNVDTFSITVIVRSDLDFESIQDYIAKYNLIPLHLDGVSGWTIYFSPDNAFGLTFINGEDIVFEYIPVLLHASAPAAGGARHRKSKSNQKSKKRIPRKKRKYDRY
jgi:hypothetical protein